MDDVNKKEIKDLLSEQTSVILDAVDGKLGKIDERTDRIEIRLDKMEDRFDKIETRLEKIEEAIRELTLTLDEFMKRVMRQDEEIAVLNAKVDKIVGFIKEKFGVEIVAQ